MNVLVGIPVTPETLRSASLCVSGRWSSITARGITTIACGVRSIGVPVLVAETEVRAR
jgi:hypothetical protein